MVKKGLNFKNLFYMRQIIFFALAFIVSVGAFAQNSVVIEQYRSTNTYPNEKINQIGYVGGTSKSTFEDMKGGFQKLGNKDIALYCSPYNDMAISICQTARTRRIFIVYRAYGGNTEEFYLENLRGSHDSVIETLSGDEYRIFVRWGFVTVFKNDYSIFRADLSETRVRYFEGTDVKLWALKQRKKI